jgi:hypothetical protein
MNNLIQPYHIYRIDDNWRKLDFRFPKYNKQAYFQNEDSSWENKKKVSQVGLSREQNWDWVQCTECLL